MDRGQPLLLKPLETTWSWAMSLLLRHSQPSVVSHRITNGKISFPNIGRYVQLSSILVRVYPVNDVLAPCNVTALSYNPCDRNADYAATMSSTIPPSRRKCQILHDHAPPVDSFLLPSVHAASSNPSQMDPSSQGIWVQEHDAALRGKASNRHLTSSPSLFDGVIPCTFSVNFDIYLTILFRNYKRTIRTIARPTRLVIIIAYNMPCDQLSSRDTEWQSMTRTD